MYVIDITLLGEEITFLSNHGPAAEFVKRLADYLPVPCFEIVSDRVIQSAWSLEYSDESEHSVRREDTNLLYQGPWDKVYGSTAIRTLLITLTEMKRQTEDRFLYHASCVENNGRAIVFCGGPGSGKTSTALSLCQGRGFRLISNDLLVMYLKDGRLLAQRVGEERINLRRQSVSKCNSDLFQKFFADMPATQNPWLQKRNVSVRDVGLNVCTEPTPIDRIVQIHLDDLATSLAFQPYAKMEEFKREMFEELSRRIRGSAYPLMDKRSNLVFAMPSVDDSLTETKRIAFVQKVAERAPIFSLAGTLDECVQQIVDDFDRLPA